MTAIAPHMGTYTSLWQQQWISRANETSYKRTGVLVGATKDQTDAVENLKVWAYSFCCVRQLTKEDISTRDRRVEPSFTRCCQRESQPVPKIFLRVPCYFPDSLGKHVECVRPTARSSAWRTPSRKRAIQVTVGLIELPCSGCQLERTRPA